MNNVDIYIDAAPVDVEVSAAQGPSGGGSWDTLTDKPAWTGTFTGAYSSLTGIPTTFTPATHTHDGVYQPAGSYAAELHNHDGVYQPAGSYAPATGIAPSAITGTAVVDNDSRLSDERVPTAAGIAAKTDAATAATPNDADLLPVAESSSVLKKITFANLWAYIKSKLDGVLTIAGAKTFSGQMELTGQAATNATSAMTRGLMDERNSYFGPVLMPVIWTGAAAGNTNMSRVYAAPTAVVLQLGGQTTSAGNYTLSGPSIVSHGDSGYNSGYGNQITFSKPFTYITTLAIGNTGVVQDVECRFGIGSYGISSNKLACINSQYGWGVKVWRKNDTTWNLALFCMCGTGPSASVSNLTNASPIVCTTATNHNLVNGDLVEICLAGGNTAANGTWVVQNKTDTTFELAGSTGNGVYTSGAIYNKISAPVDLPNTNKNALLFISHNGSGRLGLRIGSATASESIVITGMTGNPVVSFQTGGGYYFGFHSNTSTLGWYDATLRNTYILMTP